VSGWGDHLLGAFALGAALGGAPGPVQLLILSETAKGGFGRGLKVMLGANGTLFLVVAALALGFAALAPGEGLLRGLRVVGGAFLVYVALDELRTLRRESMQAAARELPGGRFGPTTRGVISVIVNPGAWIFFATTASTVVAQAGTDGGRGEALLAAVAMTAGVSLADLLSTLIGTGGRALVGERGLRWIRAVLAGFLLLIGLAFVAQGLHVL
jgi:threonine/homoserine/homoserine lactone efflux protein